MTGTTGPDGGVPDPAAATSTTPEPPGGWAAAAATLTDPGRTRDLYDAWAPSYDDDHDPEDYLAPALVADRVAALVAPGTDVLDAACGTGLVGAALAARGFTSIDGLDLSPQMIRRARRRRVYNDLGPADLTERVPGAADKFGVVTCVGGLLPGHLDTAALRGFVRVVRRGGHLVVTLRPGRDEEFRTAFDRLAASGLARVVEETEQPLRREAPGRLVLLEVLMASADPI